MRIAVLSDVHGNAIALDAVMADAAAIGVEHYWFVGDHVAIGPEPAAVLERFARVHEGRFLRGNTDRYVVTGEGPPPLLDAVRNDAALIATYAATAASFSWTRGYLTASGWLDWLDRLPLETRLNAPDGVRVLAVHAAPGSDDGEGVHPGRSNAELRTLIDGAGADLLLVGHTHEPMIRRVDSTLIVNLGSVSNPTAPDLSACYIILELSGARTTVVHRRVPYDTKAFAESVRRSRHPAARYILSFQRGERHGRPAHEDHTPLSPGEPVDVRSTG